MIVLAITTRRPSERMAAILFVVIVAPFMLLIGVAVSALVRGLKRDENILRSLEALRARLGGTVLLPTMRYPLVQPRLVAQHRGRELEVRFVRMTRRQAIMHGSEWHLMLMLAAGPTFKFGLVTRTSFGAARFLGVQVADWDARLALLSDDPARAVVVLRDPAIAQHCDRLLSSQRGTSKLQFAPISRINPLGSVFMTGWDPRQGPDAALAHVESLTAIVERAHALGVA